MITLKNTSDKQKLYIPRTVIETDSVSGFEAKDLSITRNGIYQILPSTGKKALSSVTVDVNVADNLQNKEVLLEENGRYLIEPDEEHTGLSSVAIDVDVQLNTQDKDVAYTANGSYTVQADEGFDGLNEVNIDVNIPVQQKEVSYTSNGEYTITPDDGALLDQVKVNVEFDTSSIPFVVPTGTRFGHSRFNEFPKSWDWSNIEKESNWSYMFYNCTSLKNYPKLNTENVTDVLYLFNSNTAMTELPDFEWNTGNIVNASNMFRDCSNLCRNDVLDLSGWNTSKITNMSYMFASTNFAEIKLDGWDTSNVTMFDQMFYYNQTVQTIPAIDVSSYTTTNGSQYNSPIINCRSLRNFGGLIGIKRTWYANSAESLSYESLLNIINGLADGVSGKTLYLEQGCVNMLSDEDIAIATAKGWSISPAKTQDAPIVVTTSSQFQGKYQINPRLYDFSQYTGKFANNPNNSSYFGSNIRYFEGDVSSCTNLASMFQSCNNICGVIITGTENVIDMSYMFNGCFSYNFTFSISDTSNVKNMAYMFSTCRNIKTIDLTGWDLSNVTNMNNMFYNCLALKEVRMTGDVTKVENVTSMFVGVPANGTFYYNPQYDYSKIIAALPYTWTAVPLSDI